MPFTAETARKNGRKGGLKTKRNNGLDYYARIGLLGGTKTLKSRGRAYYATIGAMGPHEAFKRVDELVVDFNAGMPIPEIETKYHRSMSRLYSYLARAEALHKPVIWRGNRHHQKGSD